MMVRWKLHVGVNGGSITCRSSLCPSNPKLFPSNPNLYSDPDTDTCGIREIPMTVTLKFCRPFIVDSDFHYHIWIRCSIPKELNPAWWGVGHCAGSNSEGCIWTLDSASIHTNICLVISDRGSDTIVACSNQDTICTCRLENFT